MLAVKHFDPVVGIDIHLIITPAGPVVPIPHPHVGFVFDPFDYLPILGATVKVNGLPRAQAGTGGKEAPPHFPIGGTFLKPPADANEVFMGSSTVVVDGEPFTYMTLPVLSCQDIGMPTPGRRRASSVKSLVLPTTIALSIPMGAPVMVGGAPTISLMGMLMKLGFAALLKGLQKLRRVMKASGRLGALSQKLHGKAEKLMEKLKLGPRLRDQIHKAICTMTGHPVDVATGRVLTDATDWELPGPLPLTFERSYTSSRSYRDSVLGRGWSHSLDLAVWEEPGCVVFRAEDGREIEFDVTRLPGGVMRPGDELYEPIGRLTLRHKGHVRWEVETAEGVVHELRKVTGSSGNACPVTRTHNRAGHEILYTYDARGRLEWVKDCAGRRILFEHDAKGRLVRVALPHPRELTWVTHNRYVYSDNGDLVAIEDALGNVARCEYQGHLLVKETDRTGLSFYFEYDGAGPEAWCVHTWGDGGIYDHVLQYDNAARITSVMNSLGETTTYYANALGVVIKIEDPLGGVTQKGYDAALRETTEVDALGNTVQYEYDGRGNCTKIIEPGGGTTIYQYNVFNQPVFKLDVLGEEWRWLYDGAGLLCEELNPLQERYRYEYTQGLLTAIIDPLGARIELQYDAQLNVSRVREPAGTESSYAHDRRGRLIEFLDANANRWLFQHDEADDITGIQRPDAEVEAYAFDAEGNLLEERSPGRQLRYGYTGFHWLTRIEEAGTVVTFGYDSEGRLTQALNEHGEPFHLERDARGEVIVERGFDGRVRRYERDAAGRVIRVIRPSGAAVSLAYTASGDLASTVYPDGSREEFTYRADGELTKAKNGTAEVELELDAVGRRVREVCNGHWVFSRYDPRGERVEVQSSLGLRSLFTVRPDGQASSVRLDADGQRAIELAYDRLGLEVWRRMPGSLSLRWDRDRQGNLEHQILMRNVETIEQRTYRWDKGPRLKALLVSGQEPIQLEYDARSRLRGARSADGKVDVHVLDATGNVFRSADHSDRAYGPGGELRTLEGIQLEHDADGNLTRKLLPDGSAWHYAYNGVGFLKEVTRPDGHRVAFEYDAFGRRLRQRGHGGEKTWVWDGNQLLHEVDAMSGSTSWIYLPERLAPVAKLEGEVFHSIVPNQLETPIALYEEGGELSWQASYDLYGAAELHVEHTACHWRLPGQYADAETQLSYNRFRYYDAHAGTYITPDPIGVDGGLNVYAYVENPLQEADPFGLDWNYVLTSKGKVYYSGRAADNATLQDVVRRHENTRGADGARFGKGDKIEQITVHGTPKNVVRGVEENLIQEHKLLIGRRKLNGNRVRGNNIAGIAKGNRKGKKYLTAAKRDFMKFKCK